MIFEEFRDDDSAVSPVIGVILMVAITVILAAVIASFVLGLGDQTDDVSPNIQFDADYDVNANGTNTTTISVNTADSDVDADNIYFRGDITPATNNSWGDTGKEISAGESVTLATDGSEDVDVSGMSSGDEIVIVFKTDSTSDQLQTFTVPEP